MRTPSAWLIVALGFTLGISMNLPDADLRITPQRGSCATVNEFS
jgi:hypothetical protein